LTEPKNFYVAQKIITEKCNPSNPSNLTTFFRSLLRSQTADRMYMTRLELEETTANLKLALLKLADTEMELGERQSQLEQELYDQTTVAERLQKENAILKKEVENFLWYFKRPEGDETLLYSQPIHTLSREREFYHERQRRTIQELDKLEDRFLKGMPQNCSAGEKSRRLKQALQAIAEEDEELKEEVAFELEDLMGLMTGEADFDTDTKLTIMMTLLEQKVEPGIIREMTNVTMDWVKGAHFIEAPDQIINFAWRDTGRDSTLNFKDCLLERLAVLRVKKWRGNRTMGGNPLKAAKECILLGEEPW